MRQRIEVSDIRDIFEKEFWFVKDNFDFHDLTLEQAKQPQDTLCFPGVYVYWKDGEVWKVGRHFADSRKRAFEHIRDNTSDKTGAYQMGTMREGENIRLILFNAKNKEDLHWVAALEVFLETKMAPLIKAGRLG